MRAEYEAIHAAGFVIQLDCPDLAMGRHTMYADESEEAFVAHAAAQVEALNTRSRASPPRRRGSTSAGATTRGRMSAISSSAPSTTW